MIDATTTHIYLHKHFIFCQNVNMFLQIILLQIYSKMTQINVSWTTLLIKLQQVMCIE